MFGLIARVCLVIASFITSWFVAADALNFGIINVIVAVVLFTLIAFTIAFFPELIKLCKFIASKF